MVKPAFLKYGFLAGLYGKELKDKIAADKCDYAYFDFTWDQQSQACKDHWNEFECISLNIINHL